MTKPWVQTFSGVAFDLLEPRAEDVRIEDIAHHLARIGRFSGATRGSTGYSVAQHALLCADIIAVWGGDAFLQREALGHDNGEAYHGDWTSPVMRAVAALSADAGAAIDGLRAGIDKVVRAELGMLGTEPPIVKRADLVALAIERKLLMAPCDRAWDLPELADTRWTEIQPLDAWRAEAAFLKRWNELTTIIRCTDDTVVEDVAQ